MALFSLWFFVVHPSLSLSFLSFASFPSSIFILVPCTWIGSHTRLCLYKHTQLCRCKSKTHSLWQAQNTGLVCLTRLTDVPPLLSLPRPGYWAGRSSLLPVEEKSHRQRIEFHMRVLASSRERGSVQDGHLFSARFFVFLSYNHLFPSFYFLSFLSTPSCIPGPLLLHNVLMETNCIVNVFWRDGAGSCGTSLVSVVFWKQSRGL